MSVNTEQIPSLATAADVMSQPVLTVEVHESLWDAWQLLFVSGLRHLVVRDTDGSCVGVLSDRSILAEVPATAEHLQTRRVGDVLARVPVLQVPRETHPRQIAALMVEHAAEAVPVIDAEGRLVGIVTESDLVRWMAR